MNKKNKLKVLRKTKKLLTVEGSWTKGTWHDRFDGKNRYCLAGALNQAILDVGLWPEDRAFDYTYYKPIVELNIHKYVAEATGHPSNDPDLWYIPNFNDADDTTEEDVIGMIDGYIKELSVAKIGNTT